MNPNNPSPVSVNTKKEKQKWKQTKSSTERNEEYIQKTSTIPFQSLRRLKDGVYKFRCVFCGDSKKNPNKRSGYFYLINNDPKIIVVSSATTEVL